MQPGDRVLQVGLGNAVGRVNGYGDHRGVRRELAMLVPEVIMPLGQSSKLSLESLLLHADRRSRSVRLHPCPWTR